ncbi:hypothetical protein V5O48_006124 [Marasmius crinis-equi]|uniref:Alpha-type protein kinase domain-containing protein n=1 Tax=Marasmius crinis-equi TaxID=585013 RepID=A0ABR3FKD3_9AGAR
MSLPGLCGTCGGFFRRMGRLDPKREHCFKCERWQDAPDSVAKAEAQKLPQCDDCGKVFPLLTNSKCMVCLEDLDASASATSPHKTHAVINRSGVAPPRGPTQKRAQSAGGVSVYHEVLEVESDSESVVEVPASVVSLHANVETRKTKVAENRRVKKEEGIPDQTKSYLAKKRAASSSRSGAASAISSISFQAQVMIEKPGGKRSQAAGVGDVERGFSFDDNMSFVVQKLLAQLNEVNGQWDKRYKTVISETDVSWLFSSKVQVEALWLTRDRTVQQFWTNHTKNGRINTQKDLAAKRCKLIMVRDDITEDEAEVILPPSPAIRKNKRKHAASTRSQNIHHSKKLKVKKEESDSDWESPSPSGFAIKPEPAEDELPANPSTLDLSALERVSYKHSHHVMVAYARKPSSTIKVPPATQALNVQRMTLSADGTALVKKGAVIMARRGMFSLYHESGCTVYSFQIGLDKYHAVQLDVADPDPKASRDMALAFAQSQLIRDKDFEELLQTLGTRAENYGARDFPSVSLAQSFVAVSQPIEAGGVFICYDAPPDGCEFTTSNFDSDVDMMLEASMIRDTLRHLSLIESAKQWVLSDVKGWHVNNAVVLALPMIHSVNGRSGLNDGGLEDLKSCVLEHGCSLYCRSLELQELDQLDT